MVKVSSPRPSAGQVLVRITASGLNPLDAKIQSGSAAHAKHPAPLVLGIDMAGVIEEPGPGVTAFNVADEVCGMMAKRCAKRRGS
jgi:NADPH2:quinone reductase